MEYFVSPWCTGLAIFFKYFFIYFLKLEVDIFRVPWQVRHSVVLLVVIRLEKCGSISFLFLSLFIDNWSVFMFLQSVVRLYSHPPVHYPFPAIAHSSTTLISTFSVRSNHIITKKYGYCATWVVVLFIERLCCRSVLQMNSVYRWLEGNIKITTINLIICELALTRAGAGKGRYTQWEGMSRTEIRTDKDSWKDWHTATRRKRQIME